MKKYKYISASDIESFSGWNIEKVIETPEKGIRNMIIISKEDVSIEKEPYLSKATNDELIEEFNKRFKNTKLKEEEQ